MAATILVSCPQCKKQLNLPDTLKGKKIRCKECGSVFPVAEGPKPAPVAPAKAPGNDDDDGPATYGLIMETAVAPQPAAAKPPPPPPKPVAARKGDDDDDSNPYGVTEIDIAPRCPHCAKEMEDAEAKVCLHCGYNTITRKKAETRRVVDITQNDKFMWLLPGFINLFLIVFVIALTYGFCFGLSDTWKYLDDEITPAISRGVRIWFVFGAGFAIFKCGRFAYTRLILNPVPPEQEIKN